MEADKLTPAQTAQLLDITTRTLRRWSTMFARSLSESARKTGQKRFYIGPDVAMLQEAKALKEEGHSLAEIADLLPDAETQPTSTALVLTPEQNIALGQTIERTRHLSNITEDHEGRLEILERRIAQLEWERLPWWKRIRTAPPD